MRFIAKQPREGINVSKTHPLAEASTLVVGLTAIFIALAIALVFAVEIALRYVTPEDEAQLFRNWMPEDLATVSPFDERLNQVQVLVDRLVRHWPDTPYDIRVEIDDSDTANAMALPGGLIIVTTGLLDQVESENELAFVLGHELGHFKNRDHLRALGRGIVLSLAFALATNGDASGISVKAADLTLRGFSRRQETAADEFGLMLVRSQYGHVGEAWRLFERWEEYETETAIEFVTYLSTHPDSGVRIEELKALAEQEGWPMGGDISPLSWPATQGP